MTTRTADARWEGGFPRGTGTIKMASGSFEGPYSFASRFENGKGTNPEELIGAAEAGCFSMALSKLLTEAGHVPRSVHTTAKVNLDKTGEQFSISSINLELVAEVPDIDEDYLKKTADKARRNCIISRALAGTDITLNTKLLVASH
ncbi:MAG: OsmC family peroxiredoxin [Chitinivibrionales bacterium]|nr:OsmC family peroxiredoxin [Chitinivibrionales bacterium]MBD3357864.1 OsmC family peroxiredoxin [Chitinivibrionales bacterium]